MKLIEAWITRHWYAPTKTWLAYMLFPLSCLFLWVVSIRQLFYQQGWLQTYRAPCPVVIVGNISVGGVGKTPLTIALYFFLKERGWTPGIVSRGYKGKYPGIAWVAADSDPRQVGDEAVLLAARTGAAVVVARQRSSAIKTLVQETACDIILSDDGLQHYAIQRDLEIVVIDAKKKLGNTWCLPAGPLREPVSRLKKVDLLVFNRGDASQCAFSLTTMSLINVTQPAITLSVQTLQGKKVHALAGIASPERFFNHLISLGAEVIAHPYPDHYQFKSRDFQHFSIEDQIIMTEKDAVKCRAFATKNSWFLPIEAQLNLTLVTALEDCLQRLSRI